MTDPALPVRELGGHTLERELGRGGMGAVYLARSPQGPRVALKVLIGEGLHDPDMLLRFEREGQVGALRHPHLVSVLDSGYARGHPFLVLEYVRGASLADRLRRGPLAPDEAARVGLAVAKGLAHLHACGVVHRDLKPGNVLLGDDGSVKVTDFGIAALQAQTRERLTQTGELLGTPAYMAPEQALDTRRVTPRTDLYSWGATLHCALTGAPPFSGPSALSVLNKVISEPPPPLPKTTPHNLAKWVEQCLAKEPDERPASAETLIEALEVQTTASRSRAKRALALGSAVLVLGVGGAVWTAREAPDDAQAAAPDASPDNAPAPPAEEEVEAPFWEVYELARERLKEGDFHEAIVLLEGLLARPDPPPKQLEPTLLLLHEEVGNTERSDAYAQAAPTEPGRLDRSWVTALRTYYHNRGNLTHACRVLQAREEDHFKNDWRALRHPISAANQDVASAAEYQRFVQQLAEASPADADRLSAAWVERYPQDGPGWIQRAQVLLLQGNHEAGFEAMEQARQAVYPARWREVEMIHARTAFSLSRFERAWELLSGWREQLSPLEQCMLGQAARYTGRYTEALAALEHLEIPSQQGVIDFHEGQCRITLGDHEGGVRELTKALNGLGINPYVPRLRLAEFWIVAGDAERAEPHVLWLRQHTSRAIEVHELAGRWELLRGQPGLALEHLQAASERGGLEPHYPHRDRLYLALSRTMERLEQPEEAARYRTLLQTHHPDSPLLSD